jgi:hypothetical protein
MVGSGEWGIVGEKPKQERAAKHPPHVAVAEEVDRRLGGCGELKLRPRYVEALWERIRQATFRVRALKMSCHKGDEGDEHAS